MSANKRGIVRKVYERIAKELVAYGYGVKA